MKIDRYEMYTRFDGSVELVIDPDGSVCYTRDVAELEAKCAELEAKCAELLEALDTLSSVVGLTAFKYEAQRAVLQEAYDIARAAIAKAKGEQP